MSQTSRMWCLDTLSSIVGTVIGIILTFGVTFWVEYKHKQEDDKKAVYIVLENISLIYGECSKSYDQIITSVPILEGILTLTPEKVLKMPEDSVLYYMGGFPSDLFVYQDFARNLLNSNFDILRNSDNYKFLFQVHHFFTLYDQLRNEYETSGPGKLIKDVNDVLTETAIQQNILETTPRWDLYQIVSSVRLKYYIRGYIDIFIPAVEYYMYQIKDGIRIIVENSGYNADDFD